MPENSGPQQPEPSTPPPAPLPDPGEYPPVPPPDPGELEYRILEDTGYEDEDSERSKFRDEDGSIAD
jgi:hypothetical protein